MSTLEIRTDTINCDLEISDTMPEIFADGISQIMATTNHTKLIFHSVTNGQSDRKFENRKGVVRLTIPTNALIEMCYQILLNTKPSFEILDDVRKQENAQIKKVLDSVDIRPIG